jgi:hypothetical protein
VKSGDYFRVINEKSRYFDYYGKIIRLGPPGQAKCLVINLKNRTSDEDQGAMVVLDLEELVEASDEIETFKLLVG